MVGSRRFSALIALAATLCMMAGACSPGRVPPTKHHEALLGPGGAGGVGAASGAYGAGGGGSAGSGGWPTTCGGYVGLATEADIAQSPRADPDAEILAYEATGKLLAPSEVYARVSADLQAIRAGGPAELADVQAHPNVGNAQAVVRGELGVFFSRAGFDAVETGTYRDWDCPNALYGGSAKEIVEMYSFVVLTFGRKRYNASLLAKAYQGLPEVLTVGPYVVTGDGSDICLVITGESYSYVFDHGTGDCWGPCDLHRFWGFRTEKPGAVQQLGAFEQVASKGKVAHPAWFEALPECQALLISCPAWC